MTDSPIGNIIAVVAVLLIHIDKPVVTAVYTTSTRTALEPTSGDDSAVNAMRLAVPQDWSGATINWNGANLGKAEGAGCWLLEEKKGLLAARRCP